MTGDNTLTEHARDVAQGRRFEFGKNWTRFLASLNDERLESARNSLRTMLSTEALAGKRFLDAGSGSGIFSLSARCLDAEVFSFDFDPQSVACTRELRNRYFPNDPMWTVAEASVLDPAYLSKLGNFDVVYSWGVLHHTGAMWAALENMTPLVKNGGLLFISIYNDQGNKSLRWLALKKFYNRSPKPVQLLLSGGVCVQLWWRSSLKDLLRLRPFATWRDASKHRGMSPWRDVVDWVGGYPFEVAKPDEIFNFYRDRGFTLLRMNTHAGALGCNEFLFRKNEAPDPSR
jgi:2-polyprenyl-3-methyl-5-hydroxy-6-metoxy-1,4-benzoquinol methylase